MAPPPTSMPSSSFPLRSDKSKSPSLDAYRPGQEREVRMKSPFRLISRSPLRRSWHLPQSSRTSYSFEPSVAAASKGQSLHRSR